MPRVKASEINFKGVPSETERVFRVRGDQQYSFEIEPLGVVFEVDRVRRSSQELWAEVVVRVNGQFRQARTIQDGILSFGDLNFSSVNARASRAKLLQERARTDGVDWHGYVEELALQVLRHDRMGRPAIALADLEEPAERSDVWDVAGWPVLRELPQVLFGDSGTGKSYFAMYVVGELARQGIPVLYADWEFAGEEHRKRLARLFNPMPKNLWYTRCDKPLANDVERIGRMLRDHRCQYLVCDSLGFAVDGRDSGFEGATDFFRALRQFAVGSLNIAHIPKIVDQGKDAQIFGSVFFRHGARSIWFIERAQENPDNQIRFGLYQRKNNLGKQLPPRGYALIFDPHRTRLEPIDVESVDELCAQLPLKDRMVRLLRSGARSVKELAEDLNTTEGAIRAMASRHASVFLRIGKKLSLTAAGVEF